MKIKGVKTKKTSKGDEYYVGTTASLHSDTLTFRVALQEFAQWVVKQKQTYENGYKGEEARFCKRYEAII